MTDISFDFKTQADSMLATSLMVECPILSRATAERIAAETATDAGWKEWAAEPPLCPKFERWVIVGRDCLGYVHNATHLLNSRNGMSFDHWKRITI